MTGQDVAHGPTEASSVQAPEGVLAALGHFPWWEAPGGTLVCWYPCQLRTVNKERAEHVMVSRRYTKDVRTEWGILGQTIRDVRFPGEVDIVAQPIQARGPMGDAGCHYPTVKAAVDGLVDAGVLRADDGSVVRSIRMMAPRKAAGFPGLLLTIAAR